MESDIQIAQEAKMSHIKDAAASIGMVPDGVGPMTIAVLMYNCVQAANSRRCLDI